MFPRQQTQSQQEKKIIKGIAYQPSVENMPDCLNFEKYVSVQSFALANFEDWSGAEYTVKLEKPENKTRENRARGNRKSLKRLKKVSYSKFRNLKLKSCEEYLSHRTSLV